MNYYTDKRCTTLKGSYVIGSDTVMEAASDVDGKKQVISLIASKTSGKVEPLFVAVDSNLEQTQLLFALVEVLRMMSYATPPLP